MLKYTAFFMLFFVLFATSCKKKSNSTPANSALPVNKNLQNDYYFKVGTYWIYKDSLTNEIDSAYISASDSGTTYYPILLGGPPPPQTPELKEFVINVNVNNSNSLYFENWYIKLVDSVFQFLSYNDLVNYFVDSSYYMYGQLVSYPIIVGSSQVMDPNLADDPVVDTGYIPELYPTMTLNSLSFNNIVRTDHKPARGPSMHINYYSQYYLCPNIGIVKMRIFDSIHSDYRYWDLLRYHIVK